MTNPGTLLGGGINDKMMQIGMDSNQFSKELNQAGSPPYDIMFMTDGDMQKKLPQRILPSFTALAKQKDGTDETGPKNECTSQNDRSFQYLHNQYAQ